MDVALYELRSEVNSAFYSAVLLDQRAHEFEALVEDLDARLAAVRARVDAGTALGRDAAEIEAELVRAQLRRDEAQASRRAALTILSDLVGTPVDTAAVLTLPDEAPELAAPSDPSSLAGLWQRPEFEQLRLSRLRLDREAQATSVENRPRIFAFGQSGLGLPGLDQFRRSTDAFWQAGIRLEWRPWTWRSAGRTAPALRLEQDVLTTEEAAWYLGFPIHDIPILVSRKLLPPLGRVAPNGRRCFATVVLDRFRNDPKWLERATDVVISYYRQKNQRGNGESDAPDV